MNINALFMRIITTTQNVPRVGAGAFNSCRTLKPPLPRTALMGQTSGRWSLGRLGFPGGSAVKNPPAMQETWVQSLSQQDPLEKEMPPTPVFLPGEFHGQKSLVGYSPWGRKEIEWATNIFSDFSTIMCSSHQVGNGQKRGFCLSRKKLHRK